MISVVSSVPTRDSDGHYLNDPISILFDQEIEASYLTGDYFQLWRTNADQTEFYEQIVLTAAKDATNPLLVAITPGKYLSPETYYVLIVTGGTDGIVSIGTDTLDVNYTLFFESGSAVRPANIPVVPVGVDGLDVFIDGSSGMTAMDGGSTYTRPSIDLFTASGIAAPIALIRSIPTDRSVGVRDLNALTFYFNDVVASGVPSDAVIGHYRDLPVDMDPFADRSIYASGVVVAGNAVSFVFDAPLSSMSNREYVFTLANYKIRGTSRQMFDDDRHVVKFMGPLTPLYATPEQVSVRLQAFNTDAVIAVNDYELYRLIHEKSAWVAEVLGITMTPANRLIVNRLVLCLVLLEMVNLGLLLSGGGIKSRTLILTSVTYETYNPSDMAKALNGCVDDALASLGSSYSSVQIGIKSGAHINRQGKLYGVYR